MRVSSWWPLLGLLVVVLGCGSDSPSGTGGTGGAAGVAGGGGSAGTGGNGGSGGIALAPAITCDPLNPSYCGFPYPNDYFTIEDAGTVTGRRLALPE